MTTCRRATLTPSVTPLRVRTAAAAQVVGADMQTEQHSGVTASPEKSGAREQRVPHLMTCIPSRRIHSDQLSSRFARVITGSDSSVASADANMEQAGSVAVSPQQPGARSSPPRTCLTS